MKCFTPHRNSLHIITFSFHFVCLYTAEKELGALQRLITNQLGERTNQYSAGSLDAPRLAFGITFTFHLCAVVWWQNTYRLPECVCVCWKLSKSNVFRNRPPFGIACAVWYNLNKPNLSAFGTVAVMQTDFLRFIYFFQQVRRLALPLPAFKSLTPCQVNSIDFIRFAHHFFETKPPRCEKMREIAT